MNRTDGAECRRKLASGRKEKFWIRGVQNNLRSLLVIRRMDRVPNAQIRAVWTIELGV